MNITKMIILSQSYNATVLYFHNNSFLEHVHCIKPIISAKRKFTQSNILPHNGFNNLFPTIQETNHFMEVGWLKKIKCMVMHQYPTCDLHLVHRKR